KKIIYGLLLLSISPKLSRAQFIFGPQAGFNYATLSNTSGLSINAKPEWHAGLLFDLGFAKHVSLQPSLLYSRRGYKYDYTTNTTSYVSDTAVNTVVTTNVDAALGYLDIPVLLNIYFGDHRGLMLGAGPQISFLLSDQSTAS